jgi:hypothetical protein
LGKGVIRDQCIRIEKGGNVKKKVESGKKGIKGERKREKYEVNG